MNRRWVLMLSVVALVVAVAGGVALASQPAAAQETTVWQYIELLWISQNDVATGQNTISYEIHRSGADPEVVEVTEETPVRTLDVLNQLGAEGWEIVNQSATTAQNEWGATNTVRYLFKRSG